MVVKDEHHLARIDLVKVVVIHPVLIDYSIGVNQGIGVTFCVIKISFVISDIIELQEGKAHQPLGVVPLFFCHEIGHPERGVPDHLGLGHPY